MKMCSRCHLPCPPMDGDICRWCVKKIAKKFTPAHVKKVARRKLLKRQQKALSVALKIAKKQGISNARNSAVRTERLNHQERFTKLRAKRAPVLIVVSPEQHNGKRIAAIIEECAKMGSEAEVLGGLMS